MSASRAATYVSKVNNPSWSTKLEKAAWSASAAVSSTITPRTASFSANTLTAVSVAEKPCCARLRDQVRQEPGEFPGGRGVDRGGAGVERGDEGEVDFADLSLQLCVGKPATQSVRTAETHSARTASRCVVRTSASRCVTFASICLLRLPLA